MGNVSFGDPLRRLLELESLLLARPAGLEGVAPALLDAARNVIFRSASLTS